jgi:integrase
MQGLRLPLDKRARQPKPTITPEQFHNLVQLISEPYATMVHTAVWTGLRVSEVIGLKWRCIHSDSITIEERYCRGDWSLPKTDASAATIGVEPQVITRISRLKTLSVNVRGETRNAQVQADQIGRTRCARFPKRESRETDERSEHTQAAHSAGG